MGSITTDIETAGPAPPRQERGDEDALASIASRSTQYIGDVDASPTDRTADTTATATAVTQLRKSRRRKVCALGGVAALVALALGIAIVTMGNTAVEQAVDNVVGVNAGERQPTNAASPAEDQAAGGPVLGDGPGADAGVLPELIANAAVVSDASDGPTAAPTEAPTEVPTATPTATPTTAAPTTAPTAAPSTATPTAAPTEVGNDDFLGFGLGTTGGGEDDDVWGLGLGSTDDGDDLFDFGGLFDAAGGGQDDLWGLGLRDSSSGDAADAGDDGDDAGCFDDVFCCFTFGFFC